MSSAYEKQRKGYETLQRTVSTLADALEKPMPDLPEPSSVTHTKDGGVNVISGRVNTCFCPCEQHTSKARHIRLPLLSKNNATVVTTSHQNVLI